MEKFNKKKLVLFLFISIFIISTTLFFIKTDSTISNKTEIKANNENQELILPKTSKVWTNFTFIHIFEDNWTNAVNWGWCSGSGNANDPYTLKNFIIDAPSSPVSAGIKIENSEKYFKIENCSVSISNAVCISIQNSKNGTLIDNSCYDSTSNGISIMGDGTIQNHTLIGNIIKDTLYGIKTYNCKNCSLYGNKLKLKGEGSPETGIHISDSHNITVKNNEILNCTDANSIGIHIEYGSHNRIIGNIIKDNNGTGIKCQAVTKDNLITDNQIINNSMGIAFSVFLGIPINNTVFKNYFIKNKNHAVDNGTNNKWNTTTIGNYWDNYTGSDINGDCIGEDAQKIPGTAGSFDYHPLLLCYGQKLYGYSENDDDDDDDSEKSNNILDKVLNFIKTPIGIGIVAGTIIVLLAIIVMIKKRSR